MKVLLTGGTGFIGRPLIRKLTERGHAIRVLARNPNAAQASLGASVEAYGWDASASSPPPPEAIEGVDAVIHLAGETIARRWTESYKKRIVDSRVLGTRNLLRSGMKPRVFISASGVGYYGDRAAETLTEASASGSGFLAEVCRAWESEVLSAPLPETRRIVIRTGMVLGARGGALEKLFPVFRTGLGGPVGGGSQWISWIHLDDLVELYLFCLENASMIGPVNGVAPQPVTNLEFARTLGEVLHRPARIPTPAFLLRLTLGEMADLVLQSQRAAAKKAQDFGFRFRFGELKPALEQVLTGY